MASIGTFGSFGIAKLAIYASSAALNVTGNNIANINTTGYCRQKLDLSALTSGGTDQFVSSGSLNFGYGVSTDSISQYRDPYMDIRYRDENTNVGELETKLSGLTDLAFVLDEVASGEADFGVIEAQLSELVEQLQILSEKAGSEEYDTLVRSTAETLVQLFNSYSSQLESVADNQLESYLADIESTNTLLSNIRDMNEQIRNASIYGDPALTLRDQRNLLIDELSGKLGIDVVYTDEDIGNGIIVQNLTIKLDGTDIELVNGIYCTQLSMPETINMPNSSIDEDGNFNFDVDDSSNYMYLDMNGNPTNDAKLADVWLNPNYPSDSSYRWLDSSGQPTGNVYEAGPAINPKYSDLVESTITDDLGDTYTVLIPRSEPYEITDDDFEPWFGGEYAIGIWDDDAEDWLKNEDGSYYIYTTTNDPYYATLIDGGTEYSLIQLNNNVEGDYDNYYMLQLSGLKDGKGNYITDDFNRILSASVLLTDTGYSGSLMANRELLTEEGEYSSLLDICMDEDATVKRGIPYYRMALDSLAQKFAEMFNEANTLMPQDIFSTNTSGEFYLYDASNLELNSDGTVSLDGNGNPMYTNVIQGYDENGVAINLSTNNMFDPAYDVNGDLTGKTNYEEYIYANGVRNPNLVTDSDGFYVTAVTADDGTVTYEKIQAMDASGNLLEDGDGEPIYLSSETLIPSELARLVGDYEIPGSGIGVMKDAYDPDEMFVYDADTDTFQDSLGVTIKNAAGDAITLEMAYNDADAFAILMEEGVLTDAYSSLEKQGALFSTSSSTNNTEGITAANISISRDWSIGDVRIVLSKEENAGSSDNSNVLYMIGMMDNDFQYRANDIASDAWVGKNEFFKGSFQEMLTNTVSTLAQDMQTTTLLLVNYEVSALALDNSRISVSGVDLNEEATNMMQYQKSYTAAAKLMTTLDECLEVLLNM